MTTTTTTLTASDGHTLDAYEVAPSGAGAAVVIVQEIFGVNGHIRSVVDRYADLGYRAIAPALFDRSERGVELDYDDAGIERGRAIAMSLGGNAITDVAAAVDHVAATGPVGVVGYCYGGSLAWASAATLPIAAAVGYYGGQIHGMMLELEPKADTMLHFGEDDHAIPLDHVREIEARHPEVRVHVYPGAGHGFNCDRRGSFDPISATIALGRTVEFLVENGVRP